MMGTVLLQVILNMLNFIGFVYKGCQNHSVITFNMVI